ncbi:DUF2325 domain-containing protein [Azospira sp. I09]|uniref:DUF2325 domain-containing protein n=1 Tax=Azospira sp. I09 TaxID=1765049 RepID=UPI001260619F|nr:DUF2325 domain-containing protein [Azospira sp. I09]BBN88415.1 hypothetical protein AZSP09_14380 [Azospira sp. I09]
MAHLPADLPPLPGATADAAIFPAGPGRSAQSCERSVLLRYLGQVQQRVGRQFEELRAEVRSELQAELQAEHDTERRALADQLAARDDQLLALRGQLMVRDTALELLREELAELRRQVPGLAGRQELVRLLDIQAERIVALERERNAALWRAERESLRAREAAAGPGTVAILSADLVAALPDEAQLTEALAAADLVLCQTGCLSHDDYWRVQDYCARSGKRCLLLAKEDAAAPAPARAAAD